MVLKPWSSDYSVGLKLIDEQHKELIKLTLELSAGKKNQLAQEQIKDILTRLVTYINVHFTTEEELLRIYEYPAYDAHKNSHRAFADKVASLMKNFEAGEMDLMRLVTDFLELWVSTHIQQEDKQWSLFIKSKIADK